ncbi:MAG: tetratricopeptide repeat protein [Acidobacteria bacterium]|nr:tetratricopeptide repeat protein [Acidobacteriota bacterium]
MRTTRLPILLALLILTTAITAQQSPSAEVAFKAAMHREVVEGNLQTAITEYKAIIARFPNDRVVRAKALVQLGGCYEKLGQTDARKAYEQVIREYADQGDAAAQARARLAAMAGVGGAAGGSAMTVRRVWDGRKANYLGGVSPDGRYLSFDDQGDLAIHDLATGLDRRLTDKNRPAGSKGAVGFSVPSPDSNYIAYSWYDWNRSVELRVIGLDGSKPRVLHTAGAEVDEEPVAWSPDGKQLLVEIGKADGTTDMMLVAVADGSAKLLKAMGKEPSPRGRFSPDGRYIAWTVKDGVSLVEVQTGKEYPLIPDLSPRGLMGWTPDGGHLLFHSERSGSPDIWRVAVAGGRAVGEPELVKKGYYGNRTLGFTRAGAFYYGVRTPTRDVYVAELDPASGKLVGSPQPVSRRWFGVSGNPDWSPDGRFLAYLRNQTQDSSFPSFIVIRSTSTGEERELRVVGMTSLGFALHWTPDGKAVVVSALEPGKGRSLVRVDVQTGQATPVTPRSLGPFPRFDLSPDGKTIFYIYAPEGSGSQPPQLLTRDLQSGRETEVLRKPGLIYVSVSPDGQRVVVGAQESHATVLRVMPATGGELRELVTNRVEGTNYRVCSWTPDGRYVIFASTPKGSTPTENVQMWRVAAEGGEPQRLDVGVDSPYYLRVHPDGRRVAIGTWSIATEIYVMENFLPKPAAAPVGKAK